MQKIPFPFAEEMDRDDEKVLTELLNRDEFKALRRNTWRPIVERGKDDPLASKYGGLPWLPEGSAWPSCGQCNRTMHLLVQLNLSRATKEIRSEYGDGLLQFFYCKRGDCPMDGKLPPTEVNLVRIVNDSGPGRAGGSEEGPPNPFEVSLIKDWQSQVDYHPHLDDLALYDIQLEDEQYDLLADWGVLEVGDKLGGWPAWIQGNEADVCTICKKMMRLIYQFEPEMHLDYSFGSEFYENGVEAGCGWLLQCSDHRDQLSFTWQCT